jgi:hypothetical protein
MKKKYIIGGVICLPFVLAIMPIVATCISSYGLCGTLSALKFDGED